MELKVNELRIGNLVEIVKYWKDFYDENYFIPKEINLDDLRAINIFKDIAKPIPLTEVFLLENGFKEKRYEYTIPISDRGLVTLTLIPHDEFPADCSVCVSQKDGHNEDEIEKVFLSEIKYVHQLQNIYFSLTNTELNKIK